MEFFQAIANMSGDSLAQHLANGISLGSLYALIAIGYTMVYGILLMINFAHGDIVMMACYFAFFGITVFNSFDHSAFNRIAVFIKSSHTGYTFLDFVEAK